MRDQLYLYVRGRAGEEPEGSCDANGSTGIAILRRDGFVSVDAGEEEGVLTTRTLRFSYIAAGDPGFAGPMDTAPR